jgi:hypothetical protein
MVTYSHVRLLILCDESGLDNIPQQLKIEATGTEKSQCFPPPKELTHSWYLDSPIAASDGNPTARLEALADAIEPFGDRLVSLDHRYKRFIDIVYHVTPQHVGGISGEFDWFSCPALLMSRISGWNLDLSYEAFWFDHPDWKRLKYPWWERLLRRFRPNN